MKRNIFLVFILSGFVSSLLSQTAFNVYDSGSPDGTRFELKDRSQYTKVTEVTTLSNATKACASASPGELIVIKNGTYTGNLNISGTGTAEKPIVVTAETPGKVILNGASTIKFGGEYMILNGIVMKEFKEGTVVTFKWSSSVHAFNCRMTNCVLDGKDNTVPEGTDVNWILIFGKYNRIDHCYIGGKSSSNTNIMLKLEGPTTSDNYCRIDHNFFGDRPDNGKNGGETIRLGDSNTSLNDAYTMIEDNFFYHCDGESEILSIKSGKNIIRRNTIYESVGGIVLRHGNGNTVESNYIFGNYKPLTGAIRVINADHKIYNNFVQACVGSDFHAPLCILKGIKNSASNGYHRVRNVVITNNTFVDCDSILIGFVNPRDAATQIEDPINTAIVNNLFYNTRRTGNQMIQFQNNVNKADLIISSNYVTTKDGNYKEPGFTEKPLSFETNHFGMSGLGECTAPIIAKYPVDFVMEDITGSTRPDIVACAGAQHIANTGKTFNCATLDRVGPSFDYMYNKPVR